MGWAGYPQLTETIIPGFEQETGIKVTFREVPDNETMFAESKIALETGGIDIIEPTIDEVLASVAKRDVPMGRFGRPEAVQQGCTGHGLQQTRSTLRHRLAQHWRVNGAWRHHIGGDALAPHLTRNRAREADHSRFGRRIHSCAP